MRSWVAACVGVLGACGFTATNMSSQDAAAGGDGAEPTGDGAIELDALGVDAPPGTCYGEFETVCLAAPASGSFTIDDGVTDTINTNNDGRCITPLSAGSTITNVCVLAFATANIGGTLRATGDRPLVLIGTDSVTISGSGAIDVGSRGLAKGAGGRTCTPSSAPTNDGGGGAGASFQFGGGNGGSGNGGSGGVTNTQQNLTDLVGGCQGFDGAPIMALLRGRGGLGGGALLLISGAITLDGSINASGGGASGGLAGRTGGGGGGSGGAIVFDTETLVINGTGVAFAQGGGGGEGATQASGGVAGESGTTPNVIAEGGEGGNGGDGGSGGVAGGSDGLSGGNEGGGGGGGGAGHIKTTDSAPSNNGNVFPSL